MRVTEEHLKWITALMRSKPSAIVDGMAGASPLRRWIARRFFRLSEWSDRTGVGLVTRRWKCARCDSAFLLARQNVPPPGIAALASPICPSCQPAVKFGSGG